MTEIFNAGRQLAKVRGIMLGALLVALAACLWGWNLFQTYGLAPGDGGVLAPFAQRLALGLTIAGLGLALVFGAWLYGRLYVAALGHEAGTDRLHIRTLTFFGSRTQLVPSADVLGSTFQHGELINPAGVRAPWYKVGLRGRSLPLIVDAQGVFVDPALVERLLKAR